MRVIRPPCGCQWLAHGKVRGLVRWIYFLVRPAQVTHMGPMPPAALASGRVLDHVPRTLLPERHEAGRQPIGADTSCAGFPHFPNFIPHLRPGCRPHESALSALPHFPHLQMQETVSEERRERLASGS